MARLKAPLLFEKPASLLCAHMLLRMTLDDVRPSFPSLSSQVTGTPRATVKIIVA